MIPPPRDSPLVITSKESLTAQHSITSATTKAIALAISAISYVGGNDECASGVPWVEELDGRKDGCRGPDHDF